MFHSLNASLSRFCDVIDVLIRELYVQQEFLVFVFRIRVVQRLLISIANISRR